MCIPRVISIKLANIGNPVVLCNLLFFVSETFRFFLPNVELSAKTHLIYGRMPTPS